MNVSAGDITSSPGFDAGQPEAGVQRRGAVDDRDRAPGAGDFRQHVLEAVDELADRGHAGALDAFLEIGDFVAGEDRLVQRQRAIGRSHGALNGSNDRSARRSDRTSLPECPHLPHTL